MALTSSSSTRVALIVGALLSIGVSGCCFTPSAPVATPTAPVVSVPAVVPAAVPTAAPAAGGGGVCGRAGDCCTAYVDAIQNAQGNIAAAAMAGSIEQVRSVCGNYAQLGASGAAAEPGCQSAIDGYRTGLTAIGVAVPAACQ